MRDFIVITWMVLFALALCAAVIVRKAWTWSVVLLMVVLTGLVMFVVVSGSG